MPQTMAMLLKMVMRPREAIHDVKSVGINTGRLMPIPTTDEPLNTCLKTLWQTGARSDMERRVPS